MSFEDAESCPYQAGEDVYCDWVEITPVSLEAGACVLGAPTGSCVQLIGDGTALGGGTGSSGTTTDTGGSSTTM